MDFQAVKKRIYAEQKIPTLLEALGCDHIHTEQGGELIVCQLPTRFHSDNRRSVQIRNTESLWGNIRSRGITGDIYSIIGYILYDLADFDSVKDKICDIKNWICNTLGYEEDMWNGEMAARDWNSWLRPIQKSRPQDNYELENEVLDESVLHSYIPYPHMLWIKDGITAKTQVEFGVMYDMDSERIVYPAHNKHGQLIGVKGRYVGSDQRVAEAFKYLAVVPYAKSIELYNLHRALPYIKEEAHVIVVESAKSCMLLTQWGYRNCVSMEGKSLSPTQARLLKELRVPITFAWDKDVGVEEIKKQTQCFKNRLVYCAYDTKGLLSATDSPTDKGQEIWEKLFRSTHKIY